MSGFLSRVELAAHKLHPAWGKQLDVRTDTGELILTEELEGIIQKLYKEVQEKKKALSELQKKRIAKAKGEGKKIGGVVREVDLKQVKEYLARNYSLRKIAKLMGINRQTIVKRLREQELLQGEVSRET